MPDKLDKNAFSETVMKIASQFLKESNTKCSDGILSLMILCIDGVSE